MGQQLSNTQITAFEREVHQIFQPVMDDVRKICRVKQIVGSKEAKFPVFGKTITQLRSNPTAPVPTGNTTQSFVTCTALDYTVAEHTDIFLNNKVSYDERQELAKSMKMAMERRLLQLVIDALVAASLSKAVAKNVSGSNDNLNLVMLSASAKQLGVDGAFRDTVTWLAHTNGLHYLIRDQKVSSVDYNNMQVLRDGTLNGKNFYGYTFYEVGDMAEGGLPKATNDRSNFAFSKEAVGLGINMEPNIDIWWDGDRQAHKVTGILSANACVIDPLGAVKITTDESIA
jgi:hypothetical protein